MTMKKIFYSMMAVALCSCAQSEVDDVITPPQPEKNGLKFEVVDNSFTGEDGTRVSYGQYGSDAAYKATFENNDAIGIFAINTSGTDMMVADDVGKNEGAKVPVEAAYKVKNAKLTLSNGNWILTGPNGETEVDFTDADLLFAYAPYDENKTINSTVGQDGRPSFILTNGDWEINKGNNRFFVHPYNVTDNSGDNFKANDWMGAVAKVPASNEEKVTFNMIHMRGMVELTTDKEVELKELTLSYIGTPFTPYLFATTETQKVYRILTTEYRNGFTVKATIQDKNIIKKYTKTIAAKSAGCCSRLNIAYKPAETITVSAGESLADILANKYGTDYATNGKVTTLRLAGELQKADWATLQGLALTSLDMYQLTNTSITDDWMKNAVKLRDALTSLVLPNGLTTIGGDALQFSSSKVISIELPASVTTIKAGAFYNNQNMSICIPENSNLQTIGEGAFLNVKNIYTDPASVNVLKIPASVTKIDGAAFGGAGLTKVIFQSETAPEIVNGAYAKTFNESVKVVVPNNSYKGKFTTGMTVFVGPGLTASNFNTPYTFVPGGWTDGIGLAGLCDGVTVSGKHWHSRYSGTYDEWGIYIDITLPTKETGYNPLTVSYTTRYENGNGAPTKVRMAVSSDGKTYTQVGEDFTTTTLPGGNETITFGPITVGANKIVRFAILEAKGVSVVGQTEQSANLAELTLYEETWTEE